MKKEDKPDGAILQRDGNTWAIVPRTPCGMLTADILESVARTVRKFEVPIVKITSGQRFALVGLREDQLEDAWEELGTDIGRASGLCLHYVQSCPGNTVCRMGLRNSLGLGIELEQSFLGRPTPAKVKVGISGCPLCCGESWVRDVGLIGRKDGWQIVVGGSSAGKPRVADELASGLSRQEAFDLCHAFLDYYAEHSGPRMRVARFMTKHPIEEVKAALI